MRQADSLRSRAFAQFEGEPRRHLHSHHCARPSRSGRHLVQQAGQVHRLGLLDPLATREGEITLDHSLHLRDIARHAIDFWLSTEDLPRPENRVTLTRDGHIQISYTASNHEPKDRLYHQLKDMLNELGMHQGHLLPHHAYLKNEIPVAGCAHQAGTCRFGVDPDSSVLNSDCRAHELDNLYVVDTSFFPSIGAVNPALTAMANAIRVGEHLTSRMA